MAQLFGRLGAIGNSLAEIVAPLDEDSESFYEDEDNVRTPTDDFDDDGAARSDAALATLRSELGDKADEIQGLHAQVSQLKSMVRGDVGGATQLTIEALRIVRPDVTKESVPSVIHELLDKSKQATKQLEELKTVVADLCAAHGSGTAAPEGSSEGESLSSMVQSLASQLRECRSSASCSAQAAENHGATAAGGEEATAAVAAASFAAAAALSAAETSELERVHSHLEAAQAKSRDLRQKLDDAETAALESRDAKNTTDAAVRTLREQVRELLGHQGEVAAAAAEEKARQAVAMASFQEERAISLKAKDHEASQLKEVISQLRMSKNLRAEAGESAIRERDELKSKNASLVSQLEDAGAQTEALRRRVRAIEARGEETDELDAQMRHLQQATTAQLKEMQTAHDEAVTELVTTRQRLQVAQKKGDEATQKLNVAKADSKSPWPTTSEVRRRAPTCRGFWCAQRIGWQHNCDSH